MNDDDRWADLLELGKYDPKLLELTVKARDALEDLAEYMARKVMDGGAELPEDLRAYLEKRRRGPVS